MAVSVTPKDVGKAFEKDYGEPHSQDMHINHFCIRLGQQIVGQESTVVSALNQKPHLGIWGGLQTNWPGTMIGEFSKGSIDETERSREERLNSVVRIPLVESLSTTGSGYPDKPRPIPIMISRACKYTNPQTVKDVVATNEIGTILAQACDTSNDPNPQNAHLDLFYLVVQVDKKIDEEKVLSILKTFPGNWKIVEPRETWPLTFFGHFPKTPFDKSEREREERLNREVRVPLQITLSTDKKPLVIITRACKHMQMY